MRNMNSHCEATNIFPDPLRHFRNSLFILLHTYLIIILYCLHSQCNSSSRELPCLYFACSLILKNLLPAPAPFFQKSNVRQRNQLMKHETKRYSTLFGKFLSMPKSFSLKYQNHSSNLLSFYNCRYREDALKVPKIRAIKFFFYDYFFCCY